MAKSAKYLQCVEQIDFTTREASLLVNGWILRKSKEDWSSNIRCDYQKIFPYSSKAIFWNIPRAQEIIVSRLRLLQSRLNSGLFKLGLHNTGLCEKCGSLEDSIHFIMECPVLDVLRANFLKHLQNKGILWSFLSVVNDEYIMLSLAKFIIDNKIKI